MSLMSKAGWGEACGKAILTGEHFVLFGSPALAVPLKGMRTRVHFEFSKGRPLELFADGCASRMLEPPRCWRPHLMVVLTLEERPFSPPSLASLGSSAALGVN